MKRKRIDIPDQDGFEPPVIGAPVGFNNFGDDFEHFEEREERGGEDKWDALGYTSLIHDKLEQNRQLAQQFPPKTYDETCWACREGVFTLIEDEANIQAEYRVLMDLIKSNINTVSTETLVSDIHDWYENVARPSYIKRNAVDPGGWPHDVIAEHLFEHMAEPALEARQQIEEGRNIRKALLKYLIEQNQTTGEVRVNHKNVDSYIKVSTHILKVYNTRPERGIGHNPLLGISSGIQNMISKRQKAANKKS